MPDIFIFLIVGALSTILDWLIFYLLIYKFNLHYQIALIMTFSCVIFFHLTANKHLTFKFKTRETQRQFILYILVVFFSLGCSLILMGVFVSALSLHKVNARIITTMIMTLPNYLLHKHLSFNKRIFMQS